MNKLLARQIKKFFGDANITPDLARFFEVISDTYDQNDTDRLLIERSLEISSRELGELNQKTRAEADKLQVNLQDFERMNRLMVDRELKMIELKKRIADLEKE